MNQKFHTAVQHKDDVTYVKLGGVIDEDNELTELTDKIRAGTVVIDLGDVERINSCGVRDWVNWLGRVERGGARPVLVECSPAIVAQVNLVNNFTGGGVVKSFYAPYFCPNCEREKVLLIEANEMGTAPHRAPVCRCDECDGVMDFDDMEDSYFAFMASAKKVAEPGRLAPGPGSYANGEAERAKIRSRTNTLAPSGSQVGLQASSLPSVPSLPRPPSSTYPGLAPAGNPGSQISPAFRNAPFSHMHSGVGLPRQPSASDGMRQMMQPQFGSQLASRGGSGNKMVYVLVAVLVAAICVLAVLLLSSGGKR